MRCPYCGEQESKVVDSRHSEDGLSIRRRRECMGCQRRFTTYEVVETVPIIVVKRNGSRQNFDKNKIINKKSGNFILIKNLRTFNSSVNLFLVRFFFITLFFNYYYLAK